MKNTVPLLACLLAMSTAFAQSPVPTGCATDGLHDALFKQDKAYRDRHEKLENDILHWTEAFQKKTAQENGASLPVYTLPIVVHIVTPPGTSVGQGNNLTDAQVEAGLALLNQAFANAGPFASPNGVDAGISFCLARRTPDGQPTNGITRTESPLVAATSPCQPFGTDAVSDPAIKKLVNWDCSQYINIWLVTDLFDQNFGCSLAGYAYFPGAPCSIDGIVQESQYWTTVSGTRVTAHEMGHYLDLYHTFSGGCANANCLTDGDRVCDTPPDGSPSFAPCNTNSCTTDLPDLPDDNTNFMDYTSCGPFHFTDGQRTRMIASLETGRAQLITSMGCQPVAVWDVALTAVNVEACAGKACPTVFFKKDRKSVV